jgi:hypothetical protein
MSTTPKSSDCDVVGCFGRFWRELRLDGNPLRRTCDRTQAVLLACLLSALVVVVPLAAMVAGAQAYSAGLRAERAERANWRQVPAVLLATAPATGSAGYEVPVRATWTAPDGTRRAGPAAAPPGTPAGRTETLWVDASGRPTGMPLQPVQVIGHAIGVAAITATAAVFALLCLGALARWVLYRRRLAAWDAEWQAVGPSWTSPR